VEREEARAAHGRELLPHLRADHRRCAGHLDPADREGRGLAGGSVRADREHEEREADPERAARRQEPSWYRADDPRRAREPGDRRACARRAAALRGTALRVSTLGAHPTRFAAGTAAPTSERREGERAEELDLVAQLDAV